MRSVEVEKYGNSGLPRVSNLILISKLKGLTLTLIYYLQRVSNINLCSIIILLFHYVQYIFYYIKPLISPLLLHVANKS